MRPSDAPTSQREVGEDGQIRTPDIGGVGEQSQFTRREALLGMRVYAGTYPDVAERDGFDYHDLLFDRGSQPRPQKHLFAIAPGIGLLPRDKR